MSQRTCYVSMPMGRRQDGHTGSMVDFDEVYNTIILPAAEMAGLSAKRADELSYGAIIHKGLFETVIGCDVFIADLTTLNPNVMYELGIRHALRRGATVLVASRTTRVPYDISYARYITYSLDPDGRPAADVDAIRLALTAAMDEADSRNDSPIHEFFPGLRVELPDGLLPRRETAWSRFLRPTRSGGGPSRAGAKDVAAESAVPPAPDSATALDIIKGYRDRSDWQSLIRFADDLPEPERSSTEIKQIVALALNRRLASGDRDRAAALMQEVIARTGGDSESYGILGRIYKDCYEDTGERTYLDKAIAAYRAGFEKQPSDYYPAINLITLLGISGDDAAKAEVGSLVPRVRELVTARLDTPTPDDFWTLVTAVQLAVLADDWPDAFALGARMRKEAPASWMLESALTTLTAMRNHAIPESSHGELDRLVQELRSEAVVRE